MKAGLFTVLVILVISLLAVGCGSAPAPLVSCDCQYVQGCECAGRGRGQLPVLRRHLLVRELGGRRRLRLQGRGVLLRDSPGQRRLRVRRVLLVPGQHVGRRALSLPEPVALQPHSMRTVARADSPASTSTSSIGPKGGLSPGFAPIAIRRARNR